MSTSSHTRELDRALQVEITIDLISLAKQQIDFLKLVNDTPALKDCSVLERAIGRYLNCWLPLASEFSPTSKLHPPIDCAWVWHCHKLNPVQYAKDCQQLFGKTVDVSPIVWAQAGQWEERTKTIWTKFYPDEPYHFIQAGQHLAEKFQVLKPLAIRNTIDYDLLAAIERQQSFFFQVCRPWMYDDRYLRVSLARYRQFLFFIKWARERHNQGGPLLFVVPTYDIDLLWHSHQLCPIAYEVDTTKSLGGILNHDDTNSDRTAGSRLQTSFADVCKQWVDVYGMVYEHAGSLYRGPEPSIPFPPIFVDTNLHDVVPSHAHNFEQHAKLDGSSQLMRRQMIQVNVVILDASNVRPTSRKGRKSYFYVKISSLQNCSSMKLFTNPRECTDSSAKVEWNDGCCLDMELSTKGLRLELMSYTTSMSNDDGGGVFRRLQRKIPCLIRKSKYIGQAIINWEQDLLNPTTELSLMQSVPMRPELLEDNKGARLDTEFPHLRFSVSVTTPSSAPFIFRILQSSSMDATSTVGETISRNNQGTSVQWVRGCVLDHTGQKQFLIWTRWTTGVQRHTGSEERKSAAKIVIDVHQVEPGTQSLAGMMNTQLNVLGSAKQLDVDPNATYRLWTLLDGAIELNVSKPIGISAPLVCEIKGGSDCQMQILSGRWLKYEADARLLNQLDHDEGNYLTVIRYTVDAPLGKAIALINWQYNAVEVMPGENVILMLLIFSTVSISLLDMNSNQTCSSPPLMCTSFIRQGLPNNHLGSVLVHRKGLSDRWINPSTQELYWEQSSPAFLFSPWYTS